MDIEGQLKKLRREVDNAKTEFASAQGSLLEVERQLKDDYGLATEKEIDKAIDEVAKQLEGLRSDLQDGVSELSVMLQE